MDQRSMRRIGRGVGGAVLALSVLLLTTASSQAAPDSCREWRAEHRRWKTEALRRYLRGAPQPELDAAVFEVLQREAYLTSCEISVDGGRQELVGWRLVGRMPEEYGSAVAESVLERAGFTMDMRLQFEPTAERIAARRRRAR